MRKIYEIAAEIKKVWVDKDGKTNIHPWAKPYFDAMTELSEPTDMFYLDTAKSIVIYFISNATSFKGEDATRLKNELRVMFNLPIPKPKKK